MRDLDDTDREILRLLLDDARRPYADIAEEVDLSPPAVADRIDRLQELGIIRRFTVDVDRNAILEGLEVFLKLEIAPGNHAEARAALTDLGGVEHVFQTAGGSLLCTATVPDGDVRDYLAGAIDAAAIENVDVTLLARTDWYPSLGEATLGLPCVECGNTVTREGVATTVDGDRYEFCCPTCRKRFEERYERMVAESE